ncbi:hypothetical protein OFN51_41010, partial [Escherichia coli]|nr:hypothetical protein [Escherichia coli]
DGKILFINGLEDTAKCQLLILRDVLPIYLFRNAAKKLRAAHHYYDNLDQWFLIDVTWTPTLISVVRI